MPIDNPRGGPLISGGGGSGLTNGGLTGPSILTTTTGVGKAFTNQPANDAVTVVSDNAGDTTQVVTVIGTTNGADTVVIGQTTLNGVTARDSSVAGHFTINGVAGTKNDWGLILALKLSAACAGTVTLKEKSGGATITTIAPAATSIGVETVAAANQSASGRLLVIYSDGATTKQLGVQGTDTAGAVAYDSQALTGTTKVTSNALFNTVTEIYTGDLEVARTATVETVGGVYLDGKPSVKNLSVTSVDNGIPRYDGTTGEVIQGSIWTLDDSGQLSSTGAITLLPGGGNVVYLGSPGTTFQGLIYGGGNIECNINVVPSAASPVTVDVNYARQVYTNEGAGGAVTFNLPGAAAGKDFIFIVKVAFNMVITAAGGDTIRIAAGVSSAGGTATNGAIGSSIRLIAINATEWISVGTPAGTWTLA